MTALRSSKRIGGPLQLLLLLLLQDLVVTGQNVEVTQHPNATSVNAGEELTLHCMLTGAIVPGGVRWYQDLDRRQPPIYSDKQGASNRGLRVTPGSNTDFSINIQNVRLEDAGIYYCVKFRAGTPQRELASGKGTVVSVIAKPSQPVIRGPTGRITAGSQASFSCSTMGFSPHKITVSWLKDGKNWTNNQGLWGTMYRVESTVKIPLKKGDVKSQLTCQIQHISLNSPLQEIFPLGEVLRVPPRLHLETDPPAPVQVNTTVRVICNAESFYPDDIKVEFFAKDAPSRKGTVAPRTSNPDGTFSLKSSLEVMATEDRNSSLFLCLVQHDSQPLVIETTTLFITRQPEDKRSLSCDSESSWQQSILVPCLALFSSKVAVLLFIACLFLIKVRRCKRAEHRSRTSQEVGQSGNSS